MRSIESPAGLGWRLGARVVDAVVFSWVVVFVVVEIDQRLLGGDPLGQRQARLEFDSGRSVVILVVLIVLYEVVPTLLYGASPGKAMFGLRIRRKVEEVPFLLAVLGRTTVIYGPVLVLAPFGLVITLVVFVSVLVAKDGRGVHDRLVGTLVVSRAVEEG